MDFRAKAIAMTTDFLENEGQYRMGYIEAEQSNPKTKNLDAILHADPKAGVRTLFSVDADLSDLYERALSSDAFDRLCGSIRDVLTGGGKIVLSGCGSSGRLCMGVERAFRRGAAKVGLAHLGDQITTIMTGGDYAVIRAVEFFEDYETLSARQVDELEVGEGDLLIGVTATAETTSILATAYRASTRGAAVWMVVCSDPKHLLGKMERADRLYTRDKVDVVYLPCGPMAVTGSTRMQSSTIEQTVLATAFEAALCAIAGKDFDKSYYVQSFRNTIAYNQSDDCVSKIADYAQLEASLYGGSGYVTYFTGNYMLDILTDSTERGPTFATPPLRQQKRKDLPLSWAFAKNTRYGTRDAWLDCFGRLPRCIEWDEEAYRSMGVTENIPDISFDRLLEFEIGNEPDAEREAKNNTVAIWVDSEEPGTDFRKCAAPYAKHVHLVFAVDHSPTVLDIFEHIGMKMILNAISTSAAALFGRVSGNYMTFLDMSNKKLIDRGARIIHELCDVPYEVALEELFYAYLQVKASGETRSPAQEAIRALKGR